MKEHRINTIISDFHFDINDLYSSWEKGKINSKTAMEKIANLCFFVLRQIVDDAIKR